MIPEGPDQNPQFEHDSFKDESSRSPTPETQPPSLRVWPAVFLVVLLWGLRVIPGLSSEISMTVMMTQFMGPLVCCVLLVLWWLFFSRALLREKLAAIIGLAVIVTVTTVLSDKTVRGFGTLIFAVPWGMTAFAVALIGCRRIRPFQRTWLALLAAVVGFGYWDLIRTDDIYGDFATKQSWRWEPSPEDRFLENLATRAVKVEAPTDESEPLGEPVWPAFRGPDRRGVQPGVVLGEDWTSTAPREIWRGAVGPGWSSFAVAGKRLFTQEQRGDDEAVVCYNADDGREIWAHQYASRFWEVVGGAGPRATPTLSDGSLAALGANGILKRLDPITGKEIWGCDIKQEAGREPPTWGFASSPLVTQGLVIVHAGGADDKGLLAYDWETGEPRWAAPAGDHSYSSPQLAELLGTSCVLMLTNKGLSIVEPASGELLGSHDWEFEQYRVVQPLVLDDSSVLLGTAMGTGTRRIALSMEDDQLQTAEVWTSRRMSPYYNDYVVHDGYLYGFDNNIFACVDLATGERVWKKGRYGNGQVLLLPDGDQLLVTSEDGELVLLRATPDGHQELARHRVLDGRTWNHPVLVGNRLYARNSEEAACYELP